MTAKPKTRHVATIAAISGPTAETDPHCDNEQRRTRQGKLALTDPKASILRGERNCINHEKLNEQGGYVWCVYQAKRKRRPRAGCYGLSGPFKLI
jgi:hypothetical protein